MGGMPGDILDLIDGALEDWAASEDAMRWSAEPERVICDGGRLWPERWSILLHGKCYSSMEVTEAPWDPGAPRLSPVQFASLFIDTESELSFQREPLPGAPPRYADVTGPYERSITITASWSNQVAEWTAEAFGFWWDGDDLHWHAPDVSYRVARRCPVCNPGCGPRPLCIDGREYARRRAARKKRARR